MSNTQVVVKLVEQGHVALVGPTVLALSFLRLHAKRFFYTYNKHVYEIYVTFKKQKYHNIILYYINDN